MDSITRRDLLKKAAVAGGALLVASRSSHAAGADVPKADPYAGARVA